MQKISPVVIQKGGAIGSAIVSKFCSPKPYVAAAVGVGAGMVLAFHYRSEMLTVSPNPERVKVLWADYTVPSCAQVGAFAGLMGWIAIEWIDFATRKERGATQSIPSPPRLFADVSQSFAERHFQIPEPGPRYQHPTDQPLPLTDLAQEAPPEHASAEPLGFGTLGDPWSNSKKD